MLYMDITQRHMLIAFTTVIFLLGFFILLSPSFIKLRATLGLPEHQPGARYNPEIEAAEIINPDFKLAKMFLSRITFVYHAIFTTLLYATLTVFTRMYFQKEIQYIINNLLLIGVLTIVIGGVTYGYISRNFFWHGIFIFGLAILFIVGIIILLYFKPRNAIDYNIFLTGLLLMIGGGIGAWLGSSFMYHRYEFVEALIDSRFNPDWAEENIYWRALTAHEHAMIALSLTLIFLLSIKIIDIKENKLSRILLYLLFIGQLFMAGGSYAVWIVGGIAHLIITPASITLIMATFILSFRTVTRNILSWGLKVGNIIIWVTVAIPGAIVATSLRKPLIFNPMFRDPLWDWAELSFNVGHWHILLTTWGIILLMIYLSWPKALGKWGNISGWITLIGYSIAMVAVNFYMLGNPPGQYIPNPYHNLWLTFFVEPGLTVMTLGIILSYLLFLKNILLKTAS